jgi:hypothetical protein
VRSTHCASSSPPWLSVVAELGSRRPIAASGSPCGPYGATGQRPRDRQTGDRRCVASPSVSRLLARCLDRRRLLHVSVTAHPTAAWVCQQLREAFSFDTALQHVLLDRDAIFSPEVCRVLERMEVSAGPVQRTESVAKRGGGTLALSLGKDSPTTRAVCVRSSPTAMVVSLPRVDGLRHRYEWRDAA